MVSLLENDPELKVKYHLSSAGKYCSTGAVLKDRPEALKKDVNPMKWNWFKDTQCLYCG